MNDRTARIAAMLGIAPIGYSIFHVMTEFSKTPFAPGAEPLQLACGLAIGFSFIVAWGIWRNYVDWTLRTCILTGIAIATVAIHLVIFESMWSLGCSAEEEILATAQSAGLYGLCRLFLPFIWWGTFVFARRRAARRIGGKRSMKPNAIRLVVGMALLPLLPCLWYVCAVTFAEPLSLPDQTAMSVAFLLSAGLGILIWVLLWRPVVSWNRRLTVLTSMLTILWLASALAFFMPQIDDAVDTVVYLSPIWMWGLWLMGTAWLWRDRPGTLGAVTRDAPALLEPACLDCGYSLRGLTEVRCPECGWSGTIDAVLSAALLDDV